MTEKICLDGVELRKEIFCRLEKRIPKEIYPNLTKRVEARNRLINNAIAHWLVTTTDMGEEDK